MSCKICTQIPITRLTLSAKLSILSWFLGGLYYIMLRDFIKQYGIEGILILGLLLSVMISVYVTIAVCLSIIIYMFASRKYNDVFREIPKVILWSAAFFCTAALVVSVARSNQTGVYIALGICIVVLTSMFLSRFMTQKLFETGISLCCRLSVLCLFMALLQLFASKTSGYRAPSTFMNANYYAMVIEFIVVMCLYKILSVPKSVHTLRYCLIILVNIVGLYISGSRTGFVVTMSILPLMFLLFKRYSFFWVSLAAIAVYVAFGLKHLDIIPRDYSIDNDLDTRLSIWITSLKGISVHPLFGGGGNSYTTIYAIFNGHKAVHAHNLVLDILLNYGIIGFALVFACFISMFKSMRKGASHSKIRYMAYAALWCVLIHGLLDVTIFWIQTSIIFLFIFSGSLAQTSQFYQTRGSNRSLRCGATYSR